VSCACESGTTVFVSLKNPTTPYIFILSAIAEKLTARKEPIEMKKTETLMPPVHPGEILREDFMKPLGLSVNKLALELHVPATRIGEIVHERRRITAETALRLARFFHTNAEFWLNLQNFYDLEISRRSGKVSEIEQQVNLSPTLSSRPVL
jgi:addiction module HigA family antidote